MQDAMFIFVWRKLYIIELIQFFMFGEKLFRLGVRARDIRRAGQVDPEMTPLIDVHAQEINDCGCHPLYRDFEPDFEEAHRQGRRAYEWLAERYGSPNRR